VADDPQQPRRRRKLPSPRGIFRWLGRFLVRSTLVVAGIVLLVAILASVVYYNRVRLLNQTLSVLVEPFRVSVGEIEFYPIGVVRIENLELAPKQSPAGTRLALIPETIITYRLGELRATRRLENLTLRGPEIYLDEPLLKSLSTPDAPTTEAAVPFRLSSLGLFTGALVVEQGRLVVSLPELPRLEGTWELETGRFEPDEEGFIRDPLALSLSKVSIGEKGADGTIATLSAAARLSDDLKKMEIGPIRLEGLDLRLTPATFGKAKAEEGQAAEPTLSDPDKPTPSSERVLRLSGIEVVDAAIALNGFDGTEGRARLPDLALETSFSLPDLHYENGRWDSEGPLALDLHQIQAGGGGTVPFFSASKLELRAGTLAGLLEDHRLDSITLEGADLLASDETLARFLQATEASPQAEPDETSEARPWIVDQVKLGPSGVVLRDLTIAGKKSPELTASLSGELSDLRFGGGEGFASEGRQALLLEQVRLRPPGASAATEPLLSVARTELALRWSDFQRENRIERLQLRGPKINFTDAALGEWLRGAPAGPEEPRPVNRPVYRVDQLEVTGGRLVADSSFATGRVPKIHADFSLETLTKTPENEAAYRLRLDDFSLRNHARELEFIGPPRPPSLFPPALQPAARKPLAEGEVIRIADIEVDFTAAGLQRTRRIDRVKVDGAVLTVGDGLKSVVQGEEAEKADPPAPAPVPPVTPPAPPANAAAPAGSMPTWTLGEVELTRSRVHFESLIPQVEGLQFAIETKLEEVPLSLEGILAQEKLQKIELAGIEIRDPYNSFITVAELPTIFVEFSLAGLSRQQIEKIDLVGPSLHVGQGLFWWIDYQRKFRAQNEGASIGIEAGVEVEKKPDWVIRTINATAGKIIISPTGVPVGVVPFPFNATTNMSEGNIELKLNIPDENHVYRFPDYKVELEGLTGDVQFNVPVKDLNNNLVQTFKLRRAKWKDYDAEDLYITVTFDADGIYGKFGGAAYTGYSEGQFNFYLNDPGKWDAWLAGTNLDTGPVTRILVPDSFLMEGKVSLKVISEGRDKQVGETSGEFQTTTPGWFDITKLDTVLETLPPEWNSLQKSLTELSLIALKRFDYDKGTGSLYFLNREGSLKLHFAGDYGTRALNLQVHDERNTKDTTAARPEKAATPEPAAPLPEASARPAAPSRLAGARPPR
jgi:hypothetical protein